MEPITRRQLLGKAGLLGTALTAGMAGSAMGADSSRQRKLKVVVTGGHPGDPEYGCGGTIALLTEAGHEVVILYLNKGEGAGGDGPRPDRVTEASKACALLKARAAFGGQIDARSIIDNDHYDSFRSLVEAERPDVMVTQWPIDNHRDHRAVGLLTFDAWLRLGKKSALYYYEVSNGEDTVQFAPSLWVDITRVEGRKRAACYAHGSQAPERFYALQSMVTRMRGTERGCEHAEGFVHHAQSPSEPLFVAIDG